VSDDKYGRYAERINAALETYLKEVAIATLEIGDGPLPEGLQSIGTRHMVLGKRYLVIPANAKERDGK